MAALGFFLREEAMLTTRTLDVLKSSKIGGEMPDKAYVRWSIARRLGTDVSKRVGSSRNIDWVVEMMLDATRNQNRPRTDERLFGGYAGLFPTRWRAYNALRSANTAQGICRSFRGGEIHYEAPKGQ